VYSSGDSFTTDDDVDGEDQQVRFKQRDFSTDLEEITEAIRGLDKVYQPDTEDPLSFINGKNGITPSDLLDASNSYSETEDSDQSSDQSSDQGSDPDST
jgi:hypothetical protein